MPGISDINWVFKKYYADNPALRRIVATHSEQVAKKAIEICKAKNLEIDERDVYCAAMLHDIGVVKCYAPDIHAFGELPYLQHGLEGQKILIEAGLSQYASVCATHTGAGITKADIKLHNLPLPEKDLVPSTLLEKLICYSDKFFSKNHDLLEEKTLDQIIRQMERYGEPSLNRFLSLHKLFGD